MKRIGMLLILSAALLMFDVPPSAQRTVSLLWQGQLPAGALPAARFNLNQASPTSGTVDVCYLWDYPAEIQPYVLEWRLRLYDVKTGAIKQQLGVWAFQVPPTCKGDGVFKVAVPFGKFGLDLVAVDFSNMEGASLRWEDHVILPKASNPRRP